MHPHEGYNTGGVEHLAQSAMLPHQGYNAGGVEESQHQAQSPGIPAPGEYMLPHIQLEVGHSAMIRPHMLGVQQARMPIPSKMKEEELVYVNAKQFYGILRRRQSRAKAEAENTTVKPRKQYLHESRHLHATRRARGSGGRFLNTKAKEEAAAKAEAGRRAAEGQSSDGNHKHNSDHYALHLEQVMMDASEGLQDGGLSSQVVTLQQIFHSGL